MKAFHGKMPDVDIKDNYGVSVYKIESAEDCFSYSFVPRLSCMGREMKDWYTLFGNLFLLVTLSKIFACIKQLYVRA